MAGKGLGDPSEQLMPMVGDYNILNIALEEHQCLGPSWFLSRKEIEEHSASRKDGINLKKETQLRVLYCSFLQDLGKKLKVPQMTIATAIMLCHRFYLRQSHAKNEWQTIATVCMFLAGKVEETPRLLTDVVVVAYETMYRRDPAAVQRIRQKEFYEKQKELILTGERLLLATIGFDLNIHHPYKPLVAALKKLKISQDDVAQVAWNFVNDWFRTTLCLQYKPHYIAAGSLFLAAKFHKVKLPSEKGMVWWHEFDITPRQLEEVIQQMLEYVEMRKKTVVPPTSVKASTPVVAEKTPSSSPDSCVLSGSGTVDSMHVKEVGGGKSAILTSRSSVNQNPVDAGSLVVERESQCQTSDCGSAHSVVEDEERFGEGENQVRAESLQFSTSKIISLHKGLDAIENGERLGEGENQVRAESVTLSESKIISLHKGLNAIDKDRIKARLARRKRERELTKVAVVDDSNGEDWIERELENGIQSRVELLQKKQRLV